MRWLAACLLALAVGLAACACPGRGRRRVPAADGEDPGALDLRRPRLRAEAVLRLFDALPGVVYTKAPLPESAGCSKPGLREAVRRARHVRHGRRKFSPEEQKAFVALLSARHRGGVAAPQPGRPPAAGLSTRRSSAASSASRPRSSTGRRTAPRPTSTARKSTWTVADKHHPITRGLADFTIHDETYGKCYIAPSVVRAAADRQPEEQSGDRLGKPVRQEPGVLLPTRARFEGVGQPGLSGDPFPRHPLGGRAVESPLALRTGTTSRYRGVRANRTAASRPG